MKTLIVDDHPLMRTALSHLIRQNRPNCEIREAGTGGEGLALALEQRFDLVLLDLRIPWEKGEQENVLYGLDLLDELRYTKFAPPTVIMSGEVSEWIADTARQQGAIAVIPKSGSGERLCAVIQTLLKDEVGTADTHGETTPAQSVPIALAELGITPRPYDVLWLALAGHPTWKIAEILGINDSNVRHYLSGLYKKFSVLNLSGLQAHFVRTGQITNILSSPRDGMPLKPPARRQSLPPA